MTRIPTLIVVVASISCGDNAARESGDRVFDVLTETATIQGAPYSGTGHVTGVGDVNGDGRVDLVLGQPMFGSSADQRLEGRVEIAYGDGDGGFAVPQPFLEGGVAQAHLGNALAVGDMNGDGIDDLVVGSCARAYAGEPAAQLGRVDLYVGSRDGLEATSTWRLEGALVGGIPDGTGCAVDLLGDLNGDGLPELAVSRRRYAGDLLAREVTVFANDGRGFADVLWTGVGSSSYGSSAIGLGDLNGDGVNDFAIASPFDGEGSVDVHSGADGLSLQRLKGTHSSSRYGSDPSAADIDNDGIAELLIGSPGADTVTLYQWLDGEFAPIWTHVSDRAEAPFSPVGRAQQIVGDVDGDGARDILIGSSFYFDEATNVGRAWLFSGGPSHEILWQERGHGPESFFGAYVGGARDTNGDGLADVWVASYELGFDDEISTSGRVRVFSTKTR